MSPLDLQEVARENHNVDLAGHKSRFLSEEMVRWADLILVMDYHNLGQLDSREISKPVVLLGEFGNRRAIADPYRKPASTIKAVLDQIANLSEELAHQLRQS